MPTREPRVQCHYCKRKRPESEVDRCGATIGGSYRRPARRMSVNLCIDCAIEMLRTFGGPNYRRAGRYSKEGVIRIALAALTGDTP